MENSKLFQSIMKNTNENLRYFENNKKIRIFKWSDFSSIKDKGNINNYYDPIEKKGIVENVFFQSKENLNYIFISKYIFYLYKS